MFSTELGFEKVNERFKLNGSVGIQINLTLAKLI